MTSRAINQANGGERAAEAGERALHGTPWTAPPAEDTATPHRGRTHTRTGCAGLRGGDQSGRHAPARPEQRYQRSGENTAHRENTHEHASRLARRRDSHGLGGGQRRGLGRGRPARVARAPPRLALRLALRGHFATDLSLPLVRKNVASAVKNE